MKSTINIHIEHGEITASAYVLDGHNVAILRLAQENEYGALTLFFPAVQLAKLEEIARLINEAAVLPAKEPASEPAKEDEVVF